MSRNPLIKPANEVCEYTPEQIQEILRCKKDVVYFANNYIKIQHPMQGLVTFSTYDYQDKMLRQFAQDNDTITLMPRQSGKTTTIAVYILWFCMFHNMRTVLVVSNKNKNAMEIVKRIQFSYENLPFWLKPGIMDSSSGWNKHSINFDNGTRVLSSATTEDAGRGASISLLFCDELAFVKPNMQEEFWDAISPTLATGGKCIIASTPNGDKNLFARLWRGSLVGNNGFVPLTIAWDDVPGRDDKFKDEKIRRHGLNKWRQEYECAFISSDSTLIDPGVLGKLRGIEPIRDVNNLRMWEDIKKDSTYLLALDPAEGGDNDYSVIEIFEYPAMTQVGEFRSSTDTLTKVYRMFMNLIKRLESVGCEVFYTYENNGVGAGITALIDVDENPPESAMLVSDDEKSDKTGLNTNVATKLRSCISTKELIERGTYKLRSETMISELKSFVMSGGSYAAQVGSSDDCVTTLLLITRMLGHMSNFDPEAHILMYALDNEEDFFGDIGIGDAIDILGDIETADDDPLPMII